MVARRSTHQVVRTTPGNRNRDLQDVAQQRRKTMKHRIFSAKTWVGLGALALSSLGMTSSAEAVSPHSSWSAFRNNSAGTTSIPMSPSATTFCYLSGVEFTDTDTGGEVARCEVTRGASNWALLAVMGASSDADVHCNARCYNN
jgi:hypothetical protein